MAAQRWPQYDPALIVSDRLTIPIQVNGKLRSKIEVPADWTEEQIKNYAKDDPKVLEWIAGKTITKEVYVTKKLLNFVVSDQPYVFKSTQRPSVDDGG